MVSQLIRAIAFHDSAPHTLVALRIEALEQELGVLLTVFFGFLNEVVQSEHVIHD